jgi:hypothetical protein
MEARFVALKHFVMELKKEKTQISFLYSVCDHSLKIKILRVGFYTKITMPVFYFYPHPLLGIQASHACFVALKIIYFPAGNSSNVDQMYSWFKMHLFLRVMKILSLINAKFSNRRGR